jgi:hypothetical protein
MLDEAVSIPNQLPCLVYKTRENSFNHKKIHANALKSYKQQASEI